jgi:hypothetical protein
LRSEGGIAKTIGMPAVVVPEAPGSGKPKKLLEQVRDVLRLEHYSLRTERSYRDWIGARFWGQQAGYLPHAAAIIRHASSRKQLRHPDRTGVIGT